MLYFLVFGESLLNGMDLPVPCHSTKRSSSISWLTTEALHCKADGRVLSGHQAVSICFPWELIVKMYRPLQVSLWPHLMIKFKFVRLDRCLRIRECSYRSRFKKRSDFLFVFLKTQQARPGKKPELHPPTYSYYRCCDGGFVQYDESIQRDGHNSHVWGTDSNWIYVFFLSWCDWIRNPFPELLFFCFRDIRRAFQM